MSEKQKPLARQAMVLAEHSSQTWAVDLPPGISRERIIEPDFWVTCGPHLGRGDIIRAIDEAGSVFHELLVREGRESNRSGFVTVAILRSVEMAPLPSGDADKLPTGHSCQWLGEGQKWAALRGSQVLRSGFDTKAEALKYFGDLALAGAV